jgi:hypothetical protein
MILQLVYVYYTCVYARYNDFMTYLKLLHMCVYAQYTGNDFMTCLIVYYPAVVYHPPLFLADFFLSIINAHMNSLV